MVKGTLKHVVVVKNPDKKNFEQAIFIVKGDIFRKSGKTESEIMAEARMAAEDYVRRTVRKLKDKKRCPTF